MTLLPQRSETRTRLKNIYQISWEVANTTHKAASPFNSVSDLSSCTLIICFTSTKAHSQTAHNPPHRPHVSARETHHSKFLAMPSVFHSNSAFLSGSPPTWSLIISKSSAKFSKRPIKSTWGFLPAVRRNSYCGAKFAQSWKPSSDS